ncbi:hypothetical protein OSB04_012251 [Centaurea solstitialis]|uniref:Reverse transcriptase Ty1/copia-type domain-containing protein n=1 Tax=Centaurea solstitialis TaxID=347529 RepID=A0AA38TU39_9ASTR|nr:hypothetical protein OSB04_012251 [Centaurea solstitialis]
MILQNDKLFFPITLCSMNPFFPLKSFLVQNPLMTSLLRMYTPTFYILHFPPHLLRLHHRQPPKHYPPTHPKHHRRHRRPLDNHVNQLVPRHHPNYLAFSNRATIPTRTMTTRSMPSITKPKRILNLNITTPISPFPRNHKDVHSDSNWSHAMTNEFNALISNKTWELVPRRPDMNVIRCMWIFRHKTNLTVHLSVIKLARFVGVDCGETFSPVVKPFTIRTVLSIALSNSWSIHQLDVKNAFLHGHLNETVYMHQPMGFRNPQLPSHVCLLKKSLYGLKQAPRAWYKRLTNYVSSLGFTHSKCNHSLFIYKHGSDTAYIILYVDDIILTSSS